MSNPSNRARSIRLVILVGLLVLMMAFLWYDRSVARPSVTSAHDTIAKLNEEINESPDKKAMTSQDVQAALNRKPSRTMTEGIYQIEVYSWMAGLPFRTRDYYAVYIPNGPDLRFVTHYAHKLPLNELTVDRLKAFGPAEGDELAMPGFPGGGAMMPSDGEEGPQGDEGEEGGKRKRPRGERPEEASSESAAESAQSEMEQPETTEAAPEGEKPQAEPAGEAKPAAEPPKEKSQD